MEEYWAQLETKVRKLILDLLEPTIRRVTEHTGQIDASKIVEDNLIRKEELIEIGIDRINSKLGIIEEFSKRLIQLDADIRISELNGDRERDKLQNHIDELSNKISNCEQNITVINGQTETNTNCLNLCNKDINDARTCLNEKIDQLKSDSETEFQRQSDKNKLLEIGIASIDKKCIGVSVNLQETDVIAKQAAQSTNKALQQLDELNAEVLQMKRTTKDQIDKIRFLAVQYNHQSTQKLQNLSEQLKINSPIQTHFQISDFFYDVFPDIRMSKKIAEIELATFAKWEDVEMPQNLKEKFESSKIRNQEIADAPLPKEPIKKKKKKNKLSLSDMLNLDGKIKNQEAKVKNLEEKILTDRNKKNTSVVEITKYIVKEEKKLETEEDDDDSSDKSSMNLELIKQNSEALGKLMGVKDYTQEIESLRLSIEINYQEFKEFTEFTKEFQESIQEKLDKINTDNHLIAENQENLYAKITLVDSSLENLNENLLKQIEKEAEDLFSTYSLIEKEKSKLEEDISSVNSDFKAYVSKTYKTIDTLEFQVQQAVNECNSASSQRKRDHSDNHAEFQKLHNVADNILKQQEIFSKTFDSVHRSINQITEFSKMSISLQFQDELDRESIALIGYKDSKQQNRGRPGSINFNKTSISLDKQCISCSGQVNMITSAFKIACLAYTPSPVIYRENTYQRIDLLEMQKKVIEGISEEKATNSTSVERIRFSKTPKPAWRPPSSLSMCVPSIVAHTPDLPPISLSKRINNH